VHRWVSRASLEEGLARIPPIKLSVAGEHLLYQCLSRDRLAEMIALIFIASVGLEKFKLFRLVDAFGEGAQVELMTQ
jgi:hypothetical protein